jgi:hypothetical protein
VTKGWEGVIGGGGGTQQKSSTAAGGRKQQKFTQLDRLFSYSSTSAPTQEEDFKYGGGSGFGGGSFSYSGGGGAGHHYDRGASSSNSNFKLLNFLSDYDSLKSSYGPFGGGAGGLNKRTLGSNNLQSNTGKQSVYQGGAGGGRQYQGDSSLGMKSGFAKPIAGASKDIRRKNKKGGRGGL